MTETEEYYETSNRTLSKLEQLVV